MKSEKHTCFEDNVRGADLAEMQLISKHNNGIRLLLFVIYIYSKYAWVVPLKEKSSIIVTKAIPKNYISLIVRETQCR